jgi:hypothetical protein
MHGSRSRSKLALLLASAIVGACGRPAPPPAPAPEPLSPWVRAARLEAVDREPRREPWL